MSMGTKVQEWLVEFRPNVGYTFSVHSDALECAAEIVLERAQGTRGMEKKLSAFGIELGDIHKGKLFRDADLPDGWKIRATSHSMWSELVDAKGSVRAMIFYKAAFYDQDAHIRFETRYCVDFKRNEEGDALAAIVMDRRGTNEPLFEVALAPFCGYNEATEEQRRAHFDDRDKAREKCLKWLEEHYPSYKDPFAYWDD